MSDEIKKNDYSADSIQALEGMEHVRKRPSMYIGDIGVRGLHHLVYEVVDNSIDEAMAGHCDTIGVIINEDGSINKDIISIIKNSNDFLNNAGVITFRKFKKQASIWTYIIPSIVIISIVANFTNILPSLSLLAFH